VLRVLLCLLVVTVNGQTPGDHSYQVLAAADDRTSVAQLDLDRLVVRVARGIQSA